MLQHYELQTFQKGKFKMFLPYETEVLNSFIMWAGFYINITFIRLNDVRYKMQCQVLETFYHWLWSISFLSKTRGQIIPPYPLWLSTLCWAISGDLWGNLGDSLHLGKGGTSGGGKYHNIGHIWTGAPSPVALRSDKNPGWANSGYWAMFVRSHIKHLKSKLLYSEVVILECFSL